MDKQKFRITVKYKNGKEETEELETTHTMLGVVSAYNELTLLRKFYNEGKEIKELTFRREEEGYND